MFGSQRKVNRADEALAQTKQQDTQKDLSAYNTQMQQQQQLNAQQDSAKDSFNMAALGDTSNYYNAQNQMRSQALNDQNQFKDQRLTDFNQYQTQKLGDQQQNFNTVDAQLNNQQQFRNNQQLQNTQYMEAHPLNMQYNDGQTTKSFTETLYKGGLVRNRYGLGGGVGNFRPVSPKKVLPIQQETLPGSSAEANQPGGYGYTFENAGLRAPTDSSSLSPYSQHYNNQMPPSNSGAGAVNGTGNLSPTATGGNVTFNPVINTGDGTANGGSYGNTDSPNNSAHESVGQSMADQLAMQRLLEKKENKETAVNEGSQTGEAGEGSQTEKSLTTDEGLEANEKANEDSNVLRTSTTSRASVSPRKSLVQNNDAETVATPTNQFTETPSDNLQKKTVPNSSDKKPSSAYLTDGEPAMSQGNYLPLHGMAAKGNAIYGKGSKGNAILPQKSSFADELSKAARKGAVVAEDVVKSGGMIGRRYLFEGGRLDHSQPMPPQTAPAPQQAAPLGMAQRMEQSYTPQQTIPSTSIGQVAGLAQNGLSQQIAPPPHHFDHDLDAVAHLAPLGMLAMMKEGGSVQSFKKGGVVKDTYGNMNSESIFTRAASLKENSKVSDHPFKSKSKSSNYGNYGGFEVSNDDDCPRLDVPFKPGFSR